jgi:hypothetical protein
LVAPKARLPSLIYCGTDFKASSLATIIVGNIIQASVKLPANIEEPKFKVITNNPSPNNPKTIDAVLADSGDRWSPRLVAQEK